MKTIGQILHMNSFPVTIRNTPKGSLVYYETECGYWDIWKRDDLGILIFYESSGAVVRDTL